MNRPLVITLIVILILVIAGTAVVASQFRGPASVGTSDVTGTPALFAPRTPSGTVAVAGPGPDVALTTLLNLEVHDGQGQNLGVIDNLLIDLRNGSVYYALLSLGRGAESTDRLYPVPLSALRLAPQRRAVVLSADPKVLANAPVVTRQDLSNGRPLPLPGDIRPFWAVGATDTRPGTGPALGGTPTPPEVPGGPAAETPEATPAAGGGGPVVLAAQIVGFEIWGQRDDLRLGTVQDLIIDFAAERARYVIMAAGDAASAGKKLLPVPIEALGFDSQGKTFRLAADAQQVAAAPGFSQDAWPDVSQPGWDVPYHFRWQAGTRQP